MTRPPSSPDSGGRASGSRASGSRAPGNRATGAPDQGAPDQGGPNQGGPNQGGPGQDAPGQEVAGPGRSGRGDRDRAAPDRAARPGREAAAGRETAADAGTSPAGLPPGAPALRTIAMPGDANPNGDIFGGWLLSQMDLAGSVVAYDRAEGRVATVAIDAMTFLQPVYVGDLVSCYATLQKTGRSSMRILVETYVRRRATADVVKVTEGSFTYVAIDPGGRSRPLPGAPVAV